MSFVWKRPEGRLKSPEQCAREIREVALTRGLDDFAAVLGTMAVAQESDFWCPWNAADETSKNYPYDSESDDGRSVGYLQQQNKVPGENPTGPRENWWGPMSSRMDLKNSMGVFLDRLQDDYHTTAPLTASDIISNVQQPNPAYRSAYAKHWDRAHQLVAAAASQPTGAPAVTDPNRPGYNEFAIWSPSNQDRGGAKIDLFLLHTQEGGGGNAAAENLANFLANPANEVSYHYTISQASDGGVTVVDCVDTDDASWSVLSANNRSINLCFAGSRVAWSRDQWMAQSHAIDVAAYLAVQDCKKYGISTLVVPPPYTGRPGISDHQYVTKVLKDGNHTDVGPNFPWDVFTASVAKYTTAPAPAPAPVPVKQFPHDYTDRELLELIAVKIGKDAS